MNSRACTRRSKTSSPPVSTLRLLRSAMLVGARLLARDLQYQLDVAAYAQTLPRE